MRVKRILFPVDFSARSREVAPFVRATAQRYGAAVTLANFVELPMVWYGAAEVPVIPQLNLPRMMADSEHNLTFFGGEFFEGVETRVVVEQGDPGNRIVETVRTSGIDLVMMPTHGRGVFRGALLGSVTAKVLHDTECPVWTAAHTESPLHAASTEWRTVVCAIDSIPEALPVIRFAADLAADWGAAIHLVHAVPSPPDAGTERYLERDFDIFLKDSARKAIEAMQKEAGTHFDLSIEAGRISSVVAAAATAHQADVVLIGRGVLPHTAGRFRTHVYAIIRDVPCPVLSV